MKTQTLTHRKRTSQDFSFEREILKRNYSQSPYVSLNTELSSVHSVLTIRAWLLLVLRNNWSFS